MESLFHDQSFSSELPSRRFENDGTTRSSSNTSIQDASRIKGLELSMENYRKEIARIAAEAQKDRKAKEDARIELAQLRAQLSEAQRGSAANTAAACYVPTVSQASGETRSSDPPANAAADPGLHRQLADLRTQVTTKDKHIEDLEARLRASAVDGDADRSLAYHARLELKQLIDSFRNRVADFSHEKLDAVLQNAEQTFARNLQQQKQSISLELEELIQKEIGRLEALRVGERQKYRSLLAEEIHKSELQLQNQPIPWPLASRNLRLEIATTQENLQDLDERIRALRQRTAVGEQPAAEGAIILRGVSQSTHHPNWQATQPLHYMSAPVADKRGKNPFEDESVVEPELEISRVEPKLLADDTIDLLANDSLF